MVFIRYLLRFCVLTVILAAGTLIVYTVLVNTGILRLPTYEQSRIEEAADKIQQEGDEATLIPDSCRFGVYNPDGTFFMVHLREMRDRKAGNVGRTVIPERSTIFSIEA